MSYTSIETSAHDGAPIEGYYFQGSQKSYRYTSSQRDVFINGLLYTPAAIKRTAISSGTQEDDNLEVTVETPWDLDVSLDYAFAVSPPELTLTIYRYHEGSDSGVDWVIVWSGKVTGFAVEDLITKFRVPSVFSLVLQGSVPTVFYQNPCNHVLYDERCKIVKATWTAATLVTVVNGTLITVTSDGFADNVLNAGEIYIPSRNERRTIVSNIANVITVVFPFFNIAVGDAVELYAGCNHSYQGDCKTKFANTLNYGGYPYIPKENPFQGTL